MDRKVGELSGLSMTDPHKRIGAFDNKVSLKTPTMEIRQVDKGMWNGPALMNDAERMFVRYLKQEKLKNPDAIMKATRGEFLAAIENAYNVGKGKH